MNTLNFYPKKIRKMYEKNMKNSYMDIPPEQYHNKIVLSALILTIISSTAFYFLKINILYSFAVFLVFNIFYYVKTSLKASDRLRKMEKVFPDVISLMASNLRAGITIDKAFLLSARPEFTPLDQEMLKTGKEIATGKDIVFAFSKMAERIDSEKIAKIIMLINTGLKAGGNISDLLEETSRNMKEKDMLEKKAASKIVMYVIFIFFAVGIGAPVLFALSSVLVEIVINLGSRLPDVTSTQMDLPFTFNQISISPNFIIYFSVIFMIVTDLVTSLIIGLVNKGEAKQGIKFFIPLALLSIGIFFVVRIILSKVLIDMISLY